MQPKVVFPENLIITKSFQSFLKVFTVSPSFSFGITLTFVRGHMSTLVYLWVGGGECPFRPNFIRGGGKCSRGLMSYTHVLQHKLVFLTKYVF